MEIRGHLFDDILFVNVNCSQILSLEDLEDQEEAVVVEGLPQECLVLPQIQFTLRGDKCFWS